MKLKIFNDNFMQSNAYLLMKEKEAILIDPGMNGKEIDRYLKEHEIILGAVFLTHGHYDHIQGLEELNLEKPLDVYIGSEDMRMLTNDRMSCADAFGKSFKLPVNMHPIALSNGDKITLLSSTFQIISTPGHTKGSISIKFEQWLFTGDTLFSDSVGRTDLFSGNQTELFRSIGLLTSLVSNQTIVYPGHGPSAKMKLIKEINPYLSK